MSIQGSMHSALRACLLVVSLVAGICEPNLRKVFAQETQAPATSKPAELPSGKIVASGDLEELVMVQAGQLPVVLSAPHGGTLQIQGVEPRQGAGMATGPSGFFTGRDAGTSELAVALADAMEKRIGKRPYLVVSKVHRKYLDPNRPSGIAYEDSDAAPVYQRYHGMLHRYCKEILEEHHTGLLLDIHGQGSSSKTLYRGTANGKTVARLRERFGESSHSGEKSLFGTLDRLGWTVFPPQGDGKEQSGFTGGYIVQTHGSHQSNGLDAMQLEFGADYRNKTQREKTAEVLAQAIGEYLVEYVDPISKAAAAKR
jgi:N-formylglutamate amidohydrolase